MQKNDIDFKALKKQFPIFKQQVHGYPFIYLDSASTAQMPQCVIDAIVDYYACYKANIGRGIYTFAEKATEKYELGRKNIANFIGAQAKEIVFTAGATEGINKVVEIWAQHHIKSGDEILISEVEHHSNFVPWQQFAQRVGAKLIIVPVNEQGIINPEDFKIFLSQKTKLVSLVHTSNVLGSTNDVDLLTKLAHEVGAKVLIDASQSVAHHKLDVKNIGCDFLVFSGHKLFGPTGIGVLFIKDSMFEELVVSEFGGGMVFSVSKDQTLFKQVPHLLEAGTQPIAQVIGLAAAVEFVNREINFIQLQQHETALMQQLAARLSDIGDIKIISSVGVIGHLVTFYSDKVHAHDIAAWLDDFGIAVRAGHHCVQPYHSKLGLNATVRVSFSVYNNEQDVENMIESLKELF